MKIRTKEYRDNIRTCVYNIMEQYNKLGSSDKDLNVWCKVDDLTNKIYELVYKLELLENKYNK